jgi:hypothetical protein
VQQNYSPKLQCDLSQTRDYREIVTEALAAENAEPCAAKPEPTPEPATTSFRMLASTNLSSAPIYIV